MRSNVAVPQPLTRVGQALDELNKIPPDIPAALGNIEGALGDLDAAMRLRKLIPRKARRSRT